MISITVVRCVEHCNNTESVCVCGWMMGGMYNQLLLSYDHKTVQYSKNGHTNRGKMLKVVEENLECMLWKVQIGYSCCSTKSRVLQIIIVKPMVMFSRHY